MASVSLRVSVVSDDSKKLAENSSSSVPFHRILVLVCVSVGKCASTRLLFIKCIRVFVCVREFVAARGFDSNRIGSARVRCHTP